MFTHSISLFVGCVIEFYIIFGLQLLRPLTEHMTCPDAENPASKKALIFNNSSKRDHC